MFKKSQNMQKQAQTLLDSVKYALHNEKGGKISSDGNTYKRT